MKAYLLAGGLGERLRPLTDRIPKCLVPINGRPLLGVWLDLCARHSVTDVLINVSRHADLVQAFIQETRWNLDIRLVREIRPLGNAGTVLAQRYFVTGEESFYIAYTDNLTDVALDVLARSHASHAAPLTMGLFHTPAPRASGIVQMNDEGLITKFEEKPLSPAGDLANAGVYVARQSLFDAIPEGSAITDFGRDVFPQLVNHMHGHVIEEFLMDIGTPAALTAGSRLWAERRAAVSRRGDLVT
jgi:mannose-1-phosphate guanylyltransferase